MFRHSSGCFMPCSEVERRRGEKMQNQPTHDPVTAPSHYTAYPVQPITLTILMPHWLGNVTKYVCRAPYSGKAKEDLAKAREYLNQGVKLLDKYMDLDIPLATRRQIDKAYLAFRLGVMQRDGYINLDNILYCVLNTVSEINRSIYQNRLFYLDISNGINQLDELLAKS